MKNNIKQPNPFVAVNQAGQTRRKPRGLLYEMKITVFSKKIQIQYQIADQLIKLLSKFLESDQIIASNLIKRTPLSIKIGQKWSKKVAKWLFLIQSTNFDIN